MRAGARAGVPRFYHGGPSSAACPGPADGPILPRCAAACGTLRDALPLGFGESAANMKTGLGRFGAVLLVLSAGCGPSALSLNQGVVHANQQLQDAGRQFGAALIPAAEGKPGAKDALQKTYDAMLKALNEVKTGVSALHAPADQSSADLLTGEKKFLGLEQSLIENEMKQLMDIAVSDRLDVASKKAQLAQLLKTTGDKERAELANLQQVQRTFAQNHNLTLK